MSAQPELAFITIEEYLEGEQLTEIRYEYINGRVHAMGGASAFHNLISLNIVSGLRTATRQSDCQVFMADMKVALNIASQDIFYYPDVLVSCDPDDREQYYRSHPCLIIEVLSPTTERIDWREKYLSYITIDSLQEYILVSQESRAVTIFRRSNQWQPEAFGNSDTFPLDCLDCTLSLDAIYEDIEGL